MCPTLESTSIEHMKTKLLHFTQALDFVTQTNAATQGGGVAADAHLTHPLEVANLLSEATHGADSDLVVAGLLHDVLKDQSLSETQLEERFGAEIAQLVQTVSHPVSGASLSNFSPRIKMLTIADQTSHLHAMLSTPQPWDDAEQGELLIQVKRSVDGMRGANDYLENKFDTAYQQAVSLLFFPPDAPRTLPRRALQMMPSRYAFNLLGANG